MSQYKKGQLVAVEYEGREFEVIVINPNGLGKDQPSLGFGFNMMEKHGGLPQPTSSKWLVEGDYGNKDRKLKTPTEKTFNVITVKGENKNDYYAIEISDWVAIAGEALRGKGKRKVSDSTKEKLIDFLMWFATKGLYAEAYVVLKGVYTARDSRSLSSWMMARLEGKVKRNKYTDFLQAQGCKGVDYAIWTNYIYEGLFGKTATEMKQLWNVVEGNQHIARNYVSEEDGLKAISHCENLTVELFINDLKEAHDDAISNSRQKFVSAINKLL